MGHTGRHKQGKKSGHCPAYCSVRCKTATKKLSSHGTTDIVRSRDILVILRSQRVKRLHYSTDLLFPGDAPLFISWGIQCYQGEIQNSFQWSHASCCKDHWNRCKKACLCHCILDLKLVVGHCWNIWGCNEYIWSFLILEPNCILLSFSPFVINKTNSGGKQTLFNLTHFKKVHQYINLFCRLNKQMKHLNWLINHNVKILRKNNDVILWTLCADWFVVPVNYYPTYTIWEFFAFSI